MASPGESEHVSHSSRSEPESSGLSSHVDEETFAQLTAMFNNGEVAEEATPVAETAVEAEPVADAESQVHLGEAALVGVPEPAEATPAVIVHEAPIEEAPIEEPQPVVVLEPVVAAPAAESQPEKRKPGERVNRRVQHAGGHHHDVHQVSTVHEFRTVKPIVVKKAVNPSVPIAVSVDAATTPAPEAAPGAPEPTPAATEPAPEPFNRKKQEELWGAKDKLKPEDVPEGELTYEQYLALRPKAEEGDLLHSTDKNGRTIVYEAQTGRRVKASEYQQDTDRASTTEVYAQKAKDRSYDEAANENAEYDTNVEGELRGNAEGKVFVEKDDRLKGLALLGKELLDLRDSTTKRKLFTPELQATLAAKEAAFKDLYALYEEKGLESRGLDYINNTIWKPYENVDYKPHDGKAWFNETHVAVHDVIESPDGDKAYVIQDVSGERQTVNASEVSFKQEFETPKKSLFERARTHFKKFVSDWQEFGGTVAIQDRWNNAKDWLFNRHITPEMTPEQIQEQKEKNRRNNMIGGAAVFIGGAAVVGLSIWAGSSLQDLGGGDIPRGGGGGEAPRSLADQLSPDDFREFKGIETGPSPDEIAAAQMAEAIQNPAYEIPDGGGGLALFDKLGLGSDVWNAHAQELVNNFPTEFYLEGGDVRLMNEGWLSEEARTYIEGLRG